MKATMCMFLVLALAACGSYKTRTSDEDTTLEDTAGGDPIADPSPDPEPDSSADTSGGDDPDDECPPVPGGCVDFCADEEGGYAEAIGVAVEHCEVEYDERGCPYLEWTTEDCRPGTCDATAIPPACIPEHECETMSCTCPAGASCTCDLVSCEVTCEGHCRVSSSGTDGTVTCADSSLCDVHCSGTSCEATCGSGGTCTQLCDGLDCGLDCDGASSCSQDCDGLSCTVDCGACTSCSQDCADATGSCTCSGCP